MIQLTIGGRDVSRIGQLALVGYSLHVVPVSSRIRLLNAFATFNIRDVALTAVSEGGIRGWFAASGAGKQCFFPPMQPHSHTELEMMYIILFTCFFLPLLSAEAG